MPPRAGLDRQAVVDGAAALIDRDGWEALTLSRLAQHLGVKLPSLYNHIDGLPGLQRELALRSTVLLGERLSEAAIGKTGPDGVMAIANAYREFVKAMPGLYQAGQRSAVGQADEALDAAQARVVRVVVAVIASFGLQGDDALHAVRGLRSLVHGFATLEAAGGFGLPLDCDESFRRLVCMYCQGLSA